MRTRRAFDVKEGTAHGQELFSNIFQRKSAAGGVAPYGYDKMRLTPDGRLLRALRWTSQGSKQECGRAAKGCASSIQA